MTQRVPQSKVGADLHFKEGEHEWIVMAVFRIADPSRTMDPDEKTFLDTENLLSIDRPGCYVCEQPYSPALAARPCPGDPSGLI